MALVSPAKRLNLTERFLDRNLAEGRGDKTAVIVDEPGTEPRSFTYAEVSRLAAQYGHELKDQGLGIEDRVFIVLDDGIEWVASFFGALKIGATVMFLHTGVSEDELAFYLADSRARGVITKGSVAERLPKERPHLRSVLVVDDPAAQTRIAGRATELEAAPTTEEDFAIWLYSSGSTGAPKAAVHRALDFVYNTERYPKLILGQNENDVTLSVPKLFFGYATGSNLLFTFYFGGTSILFPDKPTAPRLFELIERHGATILINVPTMIAQMIEHATQNPEVDTRSLRLMTSAGEALPRELYDRWRERSDVEILDGIGSAEMFHIFITNRPGEVEAGSLGKLVEGYEAKIIDADGRECGPGEIGTLWIGGGSAAAFYWQRQDKSRDVLRGRWVVSGDQFERDERGFFYYRGRADDLMKVGGRWLAPQEIENVLNTHPAVAEVGAAPFTQEGLVKPMAFVLLRERYTGSEALAKELQDHVAKTAAPYKAPRFVEFVDTLPRGDRDKLDRKQLAVRAADAARRRGLAAS